MRNDTHVWLDGCPQLNALSNEAAPLQGDLLLLLPMTVSGYIGTAHSVGKAETMSL